MIKKLLLGILILSIAGIAACTFMPGNSPDPDELNLQASESTSEAVFSGGCFWCTESDFEKVPGVIEVVSGYTGGDLPNPEYKQVASGSTNHIESVRVIYNSNIVSYEELLYTFWTHVDPTDADGSFVDRGAQYRSAIFYKDEKEKSLAEQTKELVDQSQIFEKPIVTDILPLGEFYDAEEYHQDYYKKNSVRYNFYRSRSGRDQFLNGVWTEENLEQAKELLLTNERPNQFQKPTDEELRAQLTELQYYVTQEDGTERPFNNKYWNNTDDGIYVDIVSGEPLYSSTHKYKSGTGWPSFTEPLAPENIVAKEDHKLFTVRTEIRSKHADSHLGHVFTDGPQPTGLRYCMNSAALRFVPKEDMAGEGYSEYLYLFE